MNNGIIFASFVFLSALILSSCGDDTTAPTETAPPAQQTMDTTSQTAAATLPCQLVVIKNTCWKDYDVSINLIDFKTHQTHQIVELKKGDNYAKQTFKCVPLATYSATATFSPAIWEQDKGKAYESSQVWNAPPALAEGTQAWAISMCFSNDFADVPVPLGDVSNCKCTPPKRKGVKYSVDGSLHF